MEDDNKYLEIALCKFYRIRDVSMNSFHIRNANLEDLQNDALIRIAFFKSVATGE